MIGQTFTHRPNNSFDAKFRILAHHLNDGTCTAVMAGKQRRPKRYQGKPYIIVLSASDIVDGVLPVDKAEKVTL